MNELLDDIGFVNTDHVQWFVTFSLMTQASRNIHWTEKMSESRFKDHVQFALPNLKR